MHLNLQFLFQNNIMSYHFTLIDESGVMMTN